MRIAAAILIFPLMLLSRLLSLLSPKVIGVLGRGLGRTLSALGFRKKIVRDNLELAGLPAGLLEGVYAHIGTLFLEILRNFSMSAAQKDSELHVSAEVAAKVQKILSGGKGAVFITGHIANWELFATGMAAKGIPVSIVAKKMNNAISQVVIERQRKLTKIEIIYSGGAIEKMREHLSRGRAIGFMVDQNTTGKKGIRANFFGVPASSIRGLAGLIKQTGAPVVPMCAYRLPDGSHETFIMDPLPYLEAPELPEPERSAREEFLNTQQYQTALETLIRRHPEQWMWIHRRWKTNRAPLDLAKAHLENI